MLTNAETFVNVKQVLYGANVNAAVDPCVRSAAGVSEVTHTGSLHTYGAGGKCGISSRVGGSGKCVSCAHALCCSGEVTPQRGGGEGGKNKAEGRFPHSQETSRGYLPVCTCLSARKSRKVQIMEQLARAVPLSPAAPHAIGCHTSSVAH